MALFGRKGPQDGGGHVAYPQADMYNPAPTTAFGRPPSAFRMPTAGQQMVPGTAMRGVTPGGYGQRMGTGARLGTASGNEENRPMTSNKGAGFSSVPRSPFDPLQQGAFGVGRTPVLKPADPSPEDQARDVEKKVHEILEESALQAQLGDFTAALERAKEAGKKERQLCKLREQQGTSEQMNLDLTFAVVFNLAHTYVLNEMFSEALNAYTSIVKNKSFGQSGRLRVNMGNIYFKQRKYPTAIKMFRMALDQIPATSKEVRFKIMKNIGLSFIRMGQYSDAAQTLENVMNLLPDHQTGINLLVCYHALGDVEKMKKTYRGILESAPCKEDQDEEDESVEDEHGTFRHDGLREELIQRQSEADRVTLLASQLLAPQVDPDDCNAGFDWCIDQLNATGHTQLSSEVQLAKASLFLSRQDFRGAINIFKEFEKKEHKFKARAATNLSFLYFLEDDPENAKAYADLAVETDRYNALAWVNRGNIALQRNLLEEAQSDYCEALAIEADRFEAIYNLGLVNKKIALREENSERRMGCLDESLKMFKRLHSQLPENLEVICEVASVYELKQDTHNAIKWLEMLHSLLPNDGRVSAKLGAIYQVLDDEARALHYYQEAHRAFPANMEVISWLGAFHVRNEVYEKAVPFFALAAKLQPTEVKWELMVASCHRRVQNYAAALAKYKSIHSRYPENVECLRYLVHICTELGRGQEITDYATKLQRAERAQGPVTMAANAHSAQPGPAHAALGIPNAAGHMESQHHDGHFHSPAGARPHTATIKEVAQADDDWGNEDLGEDLLPI